MIFSEERTKAMTKTKSIAKKAVARGTVLALLASAATVAFAATASQSSAAVCAEWRDALIDTRLCDEATDVAAIDTLTPISFMLTIR